MVKIIQIIALCILALALPIVIAKPFIGDFNETPAKIIFAAGGGGAVGGGGNVSGTGSIGHVAWFDTNTTVTSSSPSALNRLFWNQTLGRLTVVSETVSDDPAFDVWVEGGDSPSVFNVTGFGNANVLNSFNANSFVARSGGSFCFTTDCITSWTNLINNNTQIFFLNNTLQVVLGNNNISGNTTFVSTSNFLRTQLFNATSNTVAIKAYGTGDGGFATRGIIEVFSATTNAPLHRFSDDGGGNYGAMYLFGNTSLAGGGKRLFELAAVDLAQTDADKRASTWSVDCGSVNNCGIDMLVIDGGVFKHGIFIANNTKVGLGNNNTPTHQLTINGNLSASTFGQFGTNLSAGNIISTPQNVTVGNFLIGARGNITGNLTIVDFVNSRSHTITNNSNSAVDSCTLASGTCTIANTRVTANSAILCTAQAGSLNLGALYISRRNAGVNYTVSSTNALEADWVSCFMVN